MVVHPWAWGILALVAAGLVVLDFLGHARNPHPPTAAEAARWTLFYVGLAGVFGVGIWLTNGWLYAQEFYAGWAMEWSLSVDNLFVFILILKAFRVPRENQQKALLFGIVIALLLRLVFILLGAALVARFSWVFFLFGVWLLWTAFNQIKETVTGGGDDEEYEENAFIRVVRRVLPITDGFIGDRMLYRHGGRTYLSSCWLWAQPTSCLPLIRSPQSSASRRSLSSCLRATYSHSWVCASSSSLWTRCSASSCTWATALASS